MYYEYIDAEGVVYTYANNGTLETINFEGQITQLSYDENSKVISVNGPLDNQLNFTYNSNQTLASITSGQKKITLTYNANIQLTSIDLLTDKTLLDKEYDFETCTENCIELNADGTVKTNNADISGSDMQNGLTREEIVEVFTHLAFYAGWPAAVSALECLQETCEVFAVWELPS